MGEAECEPNSGGEEPAGQHLPTTASYQTGFTVIQKITLKILEFIKDIL